MHTPSLFVGLSDFIVRRHRLLLLLFALASCGLLVILPKMVIDGSIERIMLKGDPEKQFHERAKKLFGTDEIVSVVVTSPESIWEPTRLRELQSLTDTLAKIDGVVEVFSLSNYRLVNSEFGMLTTNSIDQRLSDGATIEELKQLAESDPAVRDNLVSSDGSITAVNLRLQSQANAPVGMQRSLVDEVRKTLVQQPGQHQYHIAGWPVIKADLTNYMERDLSVLLPVVALVVTLLLIGSFRRTAGVILPLAAVGVAQVWTLGGMVLTGHAMTIVTNSLPIIIIAIGTTYCVYVTTAIFRRIDSGLEKTQAVRAAIEETGLSVILSSFTTMVGFAALKLNRLEVISEFGDIAVWGVFVSMLMALVLMPCLALLLPVRRKTVRVSTRKFQWDRFLAKVLGHRRIVWAGTILVITITGIGISRIRVETAPVTWFPSDSETRQAVDYTNQHLAGITPYNFLLESDREGDFLEPAMLIRVAEFQTWLESQPEIDTTFSVADVNKVVFRALGGDESWYRIPDDRAGVEQVMMLARSEGIAGIESLVTEDGRAANILARSPLMSSEKGVQFAIRANEYLRLHFADLRVKKTTGNSYLTDRTNIQFTNGLVSSLALGMFCIFLVMSILFRSWKLGLLAMVPNVIPVAVNYAILGLGDLTLNAATSITGCIAIGIAVDDTIHFMVTYRKKLSELDDVQAALEATLASVGRPMTTTSITLCCGFSVLMLSNFMPVVSLGLLVATTMVVCVVCDLVLLPVLLTTKHSETILADRPNASRVSEAVEGLQASTAT